MKLSNLLQEIASINKEQDCLITGLSIDSRTIKNGDLFLAYKGVEVDGKDFIVDAVNKGASAIVCDEDLVSESKFVVPLVVIPDLQQKLGLIAAKFYDYPSRKMSVIGVTGTNGKTSIAHYVADILTRMDIPCGIIGTLGYGLSGKLSTLINTTPDPITLQRLLFELNEAGAKAVAMEVSSHGLASGRVVGIDFKIAVFTNLTHDHLDYHGTMKDYGNAKKILFLNNQVENAVINIDDEFGRGLVKELKGVCDLYTYAVSAEALLDLPLVKAYDVNLSFDEISSSVSTPWGDGIIQSKLLGRFNLSNLLAVVSLLGIMNIGLDRILAKIKELRQIKGRMQVFTGKDKNIAVVVDYAHTPDALEKVLFSLREYCKENLWCVFGCGGDRDRGKRSLMGQIAERFSDHLVITNDNPRTEDPKQIVDDVLEGLLCPWAVEVEYDREAAIEYAVNHAEENDLILIAGKGSENYQIIGKERMPFSDEEVVMRALGFQ